MHWLLLALPVVFAKEPKPVKVPGVPIQIVLPDVGEDRPQPWGSTVNDATTDIRTSMRNADEFIQVTFRATTYQPSLESLAPNFIEEMVTTDDEETVITPGELEEVEHETLGEMLVVPLEIRDNFMEQDLLGRLVFFPVEAMGVVVTSITSKVEDPEHIVKMTDEILGMIEVKEKRRAVPEEDLPYGKVTADAGYTVELPDGMRALTEEEARGRSTSRIPGEGDYVGRYADFFAVDTEHLEEMVFQCTATTDGTLEVIHPDRYPPAAQNFLTYARVFLKGGSYRFLDGTEERFIDVMTEVPVQPEEKGVLKFIELPDREAYLWSVKGELYEDPITASIFYTAYDDVALTCVTIADEDEESHIGTFEKVMRGMRVGDGLMHPMHFSLKAKYLRWWPTTHPALQLYWVPLPIFLLAGWLIFKD